MITSGVVPTLTVISTVKQCELPLPDDIVWDCYCDGRLVTPSDPSDMCADNTRIVGVLWLESTDTYQQRSDTAEYPEKRTICANCYDVLGYADEVGYTNKHTDGDFEVPEGEYADSTGSSD
jgi:hypothetical protein